MRLIDLDDLSPVEIATLDVFPSDDFMMSNDGRQEVYDLTRLEFKVCAEEWLRSVVKSVTSGQSTDADVGMRWTTWLQNVTCHSCYPPIDEQGQMITHPMILLQDRRMHCGQSARLIVDGLSAVGIHARLLQLNGHVAAEFFSGSEWILAEADILGHGQFVRDDTGSLAGLDAIQRHPEILKSVQPYTRRSCWMVRGEWVRAGKRSGITSNDGQNLTKSMRAYASADSRWASVFQSVVVTMGDRELETPFVIEKTSQGSGLDNRYYGWGSYKAVLRR